jgi:uncharacterized membrane protein
MQMLKLPSSAAIGDIARMAGFLLVFIWFFAGGIAHFLYTEVFASVVPPYVPYPREIVLATGLCEIAGALALLTHRLRYVAGLALMAFAVCVTPVHIEMLRHADRYQSIGAPLLWLRLFLQPVLIWIIWSVCIPRAQARFPARLRP